MWCERWDTANCGCSGVHVLREGGRRVRGGIQLCAVVVYMY